MNRFEGKVTLITGAASGIGAATALHFASLGSSLALNDKNGDKLTEQSELIRQEKGLSVSKILLLPGDISNEEEAKKVVAETASHFGRLDTLVNNAGILRSTRVDTTVLSDLDALFRTNFKAAFHLMQLAIPHLKKTKGNVVNVSSVASQLAVPDQISYGASKAALDHLTKSVARDMGPFGVRVNAVNPGFIETNIYRTLGLSDEELRTHYEKGKSRSVLGRVASPSEVANSIAFLASENASFITGVTLPVDGGLLLIGPPKTES